MGHVKVSRFLPSVAFILILAILPSCTETTEKTLTITGNTKVDRNCTDDRVNFLGNFLEDLILSPLVAYDATTDTEYPVLLKEAVPSDEGRVWDIKLRNDVQFHEGSLVTPDDVTFSIEKRKDMLSRLNSIIKAEEVDPMTVRLTFKEAPADVREVLEQIYVLPRHILQRADNWRKGYLERPVGTGPYKFSRWLPGGMEFTANNIYFEGRPKIDRIVYLHRENEAERLRLLLNGTADIMLGPVSPDTANFLKNDPRFYVNELSLKQFYSALFLNIQSPLFSDRNVRKAITMALNRKDIIEKALRGAGVPVYSPFQKEMLPADHQTESYEHDPHSAVTLLNESGWKQSEEGTLKKKGKGFVFKLCYDRLNPELLRVAGVISQQLYEVGIEVESHPFDYNDGTFHSLQYDALLATDSAYNPPIVWQSRAVLGKLSRNKSHYSNKEVDTLFEQVKKTNDTSEIKQIYARIDKLIHDDAPAVILYTPVYYTAANKRFTEAKSFISTPIDFYRIKDWK